MTTEIESIDANIKTRFVAFVEAMGADFDKVVNISCDAQLGTISVTTAEYLDGAAHTHTITRSLGG